MSYDVITLGETMLRLTPPHLLRIEQTSTYEGHVGGSESNVAVGLARLGLRVAWLSRMTNNAVGQSIVNAIRAYGVDTSHVVWTDKDRVGLYFFEAGNAPRGGKVIYDRAGSAMSKMRASELPHDLLQEGMSKLVHLSGITLAIGQTAAETSHELARLAKQQGALLSFDINYRQLLWSSEAAREGCHDLAAMADILFLPLRDAQHLYGTSADPLEAVQQMHDYYPQAIIVMTLSAEGAIAKQGASIVRQAIFPTEPIGRLGGGDAFVAGFLYAYLKGQALEATLAWAAASAAYKYSMLGDMPLLDYEGIQQLVQHRQGQSLVR